MNAISTITELLANTSISNCNNEKTEALKMAKSNSIFGNKNISDASGISFSEASLNKNPKDIMQFLVEFIILAVSLLTKNNNSSNGENKNLIGTNVAKESIPADILDEKGYRSSKYKDVKFTTEQIEQIKVRQTKFFSENKDPEREKTSETMKELQNDLAMIENIKKTTGVDFVVPIAAEEVSAGDTSNGRNKSTPIDMRKRTAEIINGWEKRMEVLQKRIDQLNSKPSLSQQDKEYLDMQIQDLEYTRAVKTNEEQYLKTISQTSYEDALNTAISMWKQYKT